MYDLTSLKQSMISMKCMSFRLELCCVSGLGQVFHSLWSAYLLLGPWCSADRNFFTVHNRPQLTLIFYERAPRKPGRQSWQCNVLQICVSIKDSGAILPFTSASHKMPGINTNIAATFKSQWVVKRHLKLQHDYAVDIAYQKIELISWYMLISKQRREDAHSAFVS